MENVAVQLAPNVYAGWTGDRIILLDVRRDRYITLSASVSEALAACLDPNSDCGRGSASKQDVALLDNCFAEKLITTRLPGEPGHTTVARARKPGGLHICSWRPAESPFFQPHLRPPIAIVAESLAYLAYIGGLLRRDGLLQLIHRLRESCDGPRVRGDAGYRKCHAAMVACRFWYPGSVTCLNSSAALMLMLRRRGLPVTFVIGVQSFPFYAHAWIETNGAPVSDNQEVSDYLAPLLCIAAE